MDILITFRKNAHNMDHQNCLLLIIKYFSWTFIGSLFFLSCQNTEPLPNTPESVSKQWQEYINNNQFPEAKRLSTPNAKEWVSWLEKMLIQEEPGEELPPPVFLQMNCNESNNKATCLYLQQDAGEAYRDSFFLLKINGQWLIDIPEEDLEMDETMEQLFNQMEEMINEESE